MSMSLAMEALSKMSSSRKASRADAMTKDLQGVHVINSKEAKKIPDVVSIESISEPGHCHVSVGSQSSVTSNESCVHPITLVNADEGEEKDVREVSLVDNKQANDVTHATRKDADLLLILNRGTSDTLVKT